MSLTSSAPTRSLTAVLQPTPSVGLNETYVYTDALYDALGYSLYSDYAGSPHHDDNTLFLWESGCRTGQIWNCTLACSDSDDGRNMVWDSPDAMFTLQNCLVYPILATAAEQEWLVQDPPDLLEKFNIQPGSMLAIANVTDGQGDASIWPAVNGCLQRICAPTYGSSAGDECSGHGTRRTDYTVGPEHESWHISLAFYGSGDLCTMGSSTPNADLGGPGVMLSIMQQITILVAIWLLLSFSQWLHGMLRMCTRRWRAMSVRRLQNVLAPGRQTAALIIALQEFQKTQVFLLLALQVVSLLAIEHTAWLDALTIAQLTTNAAYMVLLSTAGVYPVILGLLTLRKTKGRLEWFTLTMSLACVVVSIATWTRISRIDLGSIDLTKGDLTLDECGGINPMRYCKTKGITLRSRGMGSVALFRQRLLFGPFAVMLYLVVEKTLPTVIHRLDWTPVWAANVWHAFKKFLRRFPDWSLSMAQTVSLLCAEAWLLWGNVMIFQIVYNVWIDLKDEGMVWTIGQVIGVGVWIPVFLEWLYSALRGIEANFSIRLPGNYKVIKTDAGNVAPASVDTARLGDAHNMDQQSTATRSSYELLPNPSSDYHRVAQAHPWSSP